jgi:hypothetical protein
MKTDKVGLRKLNFPRVRVKILKAEKPRKKREREQKE